ncbi:hypothetical protein WMY93_000507 [Mugilogobius chulae]|uniref:Transcription factor Jun n=1 Tax=Mugilogobius chulae TaxID=88201 RepID=A0AAW0QEF6_9GOBI
MSKRMETTFYDENASSAPRDGTGLFAFNPKTLKQTMTLNLNDPKNFKPQLSSKALDILTSPDVGLLKLASPELERLIIQSCTGLTTPTPTQFICPKNITDEQEGFAEGFVKALAELHYQQPAPAAQPDTQPSANNVASGPSVSENGGATFSGTARTEPPDLSTCPTSSQPYGPPTNDSSPPAASLPQRGASNRPGDVRGHPSFVPIDMETQERIKAERKRMRNRVAASKCRKRKLERISRLEERVKNLKTQNTELVSSANVLRDELALLKQKVMDHVNSGCQLILTQQLQAY